jgi:hypothetical protein
MAIEIQIGEVFGSWLVKEKLDYGQKYKCVCTACCQAVKNIRVYDLLKGKSRLCKKCSTQATRSSHGMSDTPEYNTWVHLIQRCCNPKNKDYKHYGGRGITVCDIWRESFEAFYMCVGAKPSPDHSIERLDVNRGYEPGNVVWATRTEQNRNTRANVNISIDGVTKTTAEWSTDPRCSVSEFTLYKRITRGWLEKHGPEHTVFSPSKKKEKRE